MIGRSLSHFFIKGLKILRKPREKRRLHFINYFHYMVGWPFFCIIRPWLVNVFWAYTPDSHAKFNAHPEFQEVFRKFTKGNRIRNGGDLVRLWTIILNATQALNDDVPGDVAELGVWKGHTSAVLGHYASMRGRKIHLFDTFEGFSDSDLKGVDQDKGTGFTDTSLEKVKENLGLPSNQVNFVMGRFPDSLKPEHMDLKFSLVSLDCDLYLPMKAGLEYFYPRLSQGGIIFVHDYSSIYWDGTKRAVDEFLQTVNEFPILIADKSGTAIIRKSRGL